jgi:hypothetical protein
MSVFLLLMAASLRRACSNSNFPVALGIQRAELSGGGLRTTEPGLCHARRWLPPAHSTRDGFAPVGDLIGERPEPVEEGSRIFTCSRSLLNGCGREFMEAIHADVGMGPMILEIGLIQVAAKCPDVALIKER